MNEQEERPEYRSDRPDRPGWYDVLVNGKEDRLVFRYCGTCGNFIWQDIHGVRAEGEVLWIPGSWDINP